MNLRKDHYRSFTRTLRTVIVSFLFPWGSRERLLRIEEHPASADHSALHAPARRPPPEERLRPSLASSPIQEITQLLSVDILA